MAAEQNTERKLKALLCTYVKGYSLLMSEGEAHIIKTLEKNSNIDGMQGEDYNTTETKYGTSVSQSLMQILWGIKP